ncbi:MAG: HI0074 family nucleotidyltransferase substrate-binding subunit [Bacteroidota bacterium]
MEKDIRWIQRFNNYRKALTRLSETISQSKERSLSDIEQAGLIQYFEVTFDLCWKTLQDLLREKERPNCNGGPSVILRQAMDDGYISGDDQWLALKKSRELTSHVYDEEMATEAVEVIVRVYHGLFIQLETRLQLEKINQEKDR